LKSFKPWIYRIATNFCHEEGRKKARRSTVFLDIFSGKKKGESAEEKIAFHRDFNPEPSFQQAELETILKKCLMQLPEENRSVIIMKEYEGFKFHEIAEALETSENTIKTRMYRGLKMMKKHLDEQNITKETIYYEL
jgi:RNA polymerase sigma-70 factor (ECF subfamily)